MVMMMVIMMMTVMTVMTMTMTMMAMSFQLTGAAAGGFSWQAPMGGVLFAIEEASSFWSLPLTWWVLATSTLPWLIKLITFTGRNSAH